MLSALVKPSGRSTHEELRALLLPFLHPDVIPLVLAYEATIQFHLQRTFGSVGAGDGDLNLPTGLLLHGDELFLVDQWNHRIQVFHPGTGRFLRKWGRRGEDEGGLLYPKSVAVGLSNQDEGGHETEVFITDNTHIHVFRLRDSQFLRRFEFRHLFLN